MDKFLRWNPFKYVMSDLWESLREKQVGGKKALAEIQTKALSSKYIYRVLCCFENLTIANFIVWGVKKQVLNKMLNEHFLYFHINSEGSGEFYFKKELVPLLDKIGGWSEPLEVLDFRDLPITSFKLEKLKPMTERTDG